MTHSIKFLIAGLATATAAALAPAIASADWKPTKPIEFVVPAGTGGGADQMARVIQGIVEKHKLSPQPLVVVNKSGGAGAEGFLAVKDAKRDPHKIIITLSNLFTTPLATGVPFNWKDMTPVAMLALDEFILWVNSDTPYKTAQDYIKAVKAEPGKFKMGGTGSKQEDQIITAQMEQALGLKYIYVPYRGGGEVAVQLVGKHVDSSVNNPIEAVAQWRGGQLRPLCVFDAVRLPYKEKMTADMAWGDIPTCKESGVDIQYVMLRGIFTTPDATKDQIAFYIDLLTKVRGTPEWTDLMNNGAFNQTFMTGDDYRKWLEAAEKTHREVMAKAEFLAK